MDKEIISFDEIIKEASSGSDNMVKSLPLIFQTYEINYTKYIKKSVDNFSYANLFVPNLIIVDRRKLNKTLDEFIKSAADFYEDDIKLSESRRPVKYLLCNTLQNTLLSEFDDIRNLFLRYINFFKIERLQDYTKPKNIGYSELLCGNIVVAIAKENVDSTAPLSFHISVERTINDKLYYYDFPCIRYGISSSRAFIFEIEKVEDRKVEKEDKEYNIELKSYQKTVDNLLQKAIKTKEINYKEVFVLTAFLMILSQRGIKEIIVPTVLINKYNGLEIYGKSNINRLNKIYEEASTKGDTKTLELSVSKISVLKDMLKKHSKSVENRNTNMIKNFKFIEDIFSNFRIYDYPMQKDTNLYFYIIDNGNECTNYLLQEISDIVVKYEEKLNILKEMK